MHIAPYNNNNQPIVDIYDPITPLVFFNIVKLKAGETFTHHLADYESCIVPATGSIDVVIGQWHANNVGGRGVDVWDGEPNAVYVPVGMTAELSAKNDCENLCVARNSTKYMNHLWCVPKTLTLSSMKATTPKRIGKSNTFWGRTRRGVLVVCWFLSCTLWAKGGWSVSRPTSMTPTACHMKPIMTRSTISGFAPDMDLVCSYCSESWPSRGSLSYC